MYIKSIEFTNFKSFGKKVKIPFFDDFTTISGPNGSGKSNIIDGILFVLGLSGSRTLRAEKLNDLIYNNGHAKKKPNYTQVSIYFDNKDRELPLDADTIVISRKIKETENGYYSYFYLNGKAASLSDVHNVLAKGRVTPEGYNVVMQGDVTRIITMSPTERRKIIDEIAGVSEFDAKKERALNELEIVRERIERVDIIISEVITQLEKLRGERDQALKYKGLKDEKIKYEGYILLSKLKDSKEELNSISLELENKKLSQSNLKQSVDKSYENLQTAEKEFNDLNMNIRKMGEDEQIQVKKEIEEIRGDIFRFNSSIELKEAEIKELEEKKKNAFIGIDESKTVLVDIESQLKDQETRKDSLHDQINDHKNERQLLISKISEIDSRYASTKAELNNIKDELEGLKNRKSELLREEDRLLDSLRRKSSELKEIENEIEESKQKVYSADSDRKSLEYDIEKLKENIGSLEKDIDDLESNRAQVKQVLHELDGKLRDYQQKYAKVEARVKAAEDSGNYSKAVDVILKASKRKIIPGIYGTIAELGKVDQEHSTALEVAAGGRMQSIVVDNDDDAANAIDFLKNKNSGRATFLPLNKMERRRPYKDLSNKEGVIGYAIDLIDFDLKFEAAFWYVFRDTLIVDTLANARRLMGGLRMVTLDGEAIEKSGAMTGGSVKRSRLSFAAAEKEKLMSLGEKITEYESRRDSTLKKLDSVESHISNIKKEINKSENEISKKELHLEEISSRGERLDELIKSRSSSLEQIKIEQNDIRNHMSQIIGEKEEVEEKITSLSKEAELIESKLADSRIPELNKKVSNIDETIKNLGDKSFEVQSRINSLELDYEYTKKKINDNREYIGEIESKKEDYKNQIASYKEKIEQMNLQLLSMQNKEKELSEKLVELRNERDKKESDYKKLKENFESLKSNFESMKREIDGLESTKEALRDQIDDLVSEIDRRDIEIESKVPSYETVKTRISSIERSMEKLEPVNMRAIDEYDSVEQRLEELKEKRDVLFNEREGIIYRIDQYEDLKKSSFMEAFDGINEHFKLIFNELSDGSGELVLDNYDDPFSGGLTLKAQPKDKSLQRLEAMSGGEKSLTALAFVFSIQQYRPAPFYAFDEIDMFLDGANAERVAKRIKKSTEYAQFIVVSLRKPMIEAASRTIGVSMQDDNISNITGVKIR